MLTVFLLTFEVFKLWDTQDSIASLKAFYYTAQLPLRICVRCLFISSVLILDLP